MKTFQLQAASVCVTLLVFAPCVLHAAPVQEGDSRQQQSAGELSRADVARLQGRQAQLRNALASNRGANGEALTAEQRTRMQAQLADLDARIAASKPVLDKPKPTTANASAKPQQADRAARDPVAQRLKATEITRLEARASELQKQLAGGTDGTGPKLTREQSAQMQQEFDEVSAKLAKLKH